MYNNNYNARVVPEFMAYGGTPVGIPTGAVPQNATGGAIPQWALGQQNQNQDQPQSTTQFAQNNMQMNDGTTGFNPNYISDDDLYGKMWNNIEVLERVKSFPYLDTKGLITIGGGVNVNDINSFMKVNFTVEGMPATNEQKISAYNTLRQMSEAKDINGNYLNRNSKADSFEDKTNLRISMDEAHRLSSNHMVDDLAHVRNQFADFDTFPTPLKEVLLDIQYNTGALNREKWPNLYGAIERKDVWGENGIVNNVHRTDVQPKRNIWAKSMAQSIRF